MPQGKGTYGSKVGRPPTKQKKHSATDAIKEVDTKSTGYSNQDKAKRKTQKEIYKAKLSGNYMDLTGDKLKKASYDDPAGTAVSKPYKMHSPLEYAPFKMKAADYDNSPMRKNFGIGDSEMPIKTAPVKFGGLMGRLFGRNKQNQQPEQPQDPVAQATQAAQAQAQPQAQGTMMQQEMAGAEQAGGAEGGEVQPHGPEAHTGGAGPIGGMQKRKAQAMMGGAGSFLFGGNK